LVETLEECGIQNVPNRFVFVVKHAFLVDLISQFSQLDPLFVGQERSERETALINFVEHVFVFLFFEDRISFRCDLRDVGFRNFVDLVIKVVLLILGIRLIFIEGFVLVSLIL